ncbi:MMPL family transporter, partial [Streptomyces sp. NBRC 110611]|uniref:MMPL family transporter n=1 Tax=Streptomyces sp. NBRC 110611 TaxID=1621259 RepID=UPI000829A108
MLAVAVLVAGIAAPAAASVSDRTVFGEYQVPGSPSDRAADVLRARGDTSQPDLVAVVTPRDAHTPSATVRLQARELAMSLARRPETAHVDSAWEPGDPHRLLFRDGMSGTVRMLLHGDRIERQRVVDALITDYSGPRGRVDVRFTGVAALEHSGDALGHDELRRLELLAAVPTAALLLLCFGGVLAALLPLLIAGLTLLLTAAVLWAAAGATTVTGSTLNVASCLGLGLAVDYCLFLFYRYRRHRTAGDSVPDAVTAMLLSTGRMVLYSAAVVSLSMAALVLFPLDHLRSFAVAGAAVALLSALAALTLLPAAVVLLAPRLDAGRRGLLRPGGFADTGRAGGWQRLGAVVMRRPWLFLAATLIPLLTLSFPLTQARFEGPDITALPTGSPTRTAAERLAYEAGPTGPPVAVSVAVTDRTAASGRSLAAYAGRLAQVPGVLRTAADPRAGTVQVHSRVTPASPEGVRLAERLRAVPPPDGGALLGGHAARTLDVRDTLLTRIPWVLGATAIAALVLIHLFTGSVLLPLKAVLLNLMSLCAGLGVVVWIFQQGHLPGFSDGAHDMVVPMLMVFLTFGVSMDYEMFLLAQIREEYLRDSDTSRAVARGLG